jgi:hypothetical protein
MDSPNVVFNSEMEEKECLYLKLMNIRYDDLFYTYNDVCDLFYRFLCLFFKRGKRDKRDQLNGYIISDNNDTIKKLKDVARHLLNGIDFVRYHEWIPNYAETLNSVCDRFLLVENIRRQKFQKFLGSLDDIFKKDAPIWKY